MAMKNSERSYNSRPLNDMKLSAQLNITIISQFLPRKTIFNVLIQINVWVLFISNTQSIHCKECLCIELQYYIICSLILGALTFQKNDNILCNGYIIITLIIFTL